MSATLPTKEFYIVGIGASAGGLEAMLQLFSSLVPNGRGAYLVAQHMAKDGHIELVLRMLNRQNNLPVIEAQANQSIEPDHVYLLPPTCSGVVESGRIQLLPVASDHLSSPSVNALFNSIAHAAEQRAIGIVLSGTGSDGVSGCRAIKAHGGMVFAQSPESASFDGMPSAVIRANIADHVLPPDAIARQLNTMFHGRRPTPLGHAVPTSQPMPTAPSLPLARLVKQVFEATGIDFSSYKEETLLRRIDRRMSTLQIGSFEEYLDHVGKSPRELHVLQHLFLVSLSSFFRDEPAFGVVRKHLGPLLAHKQPGDAIRIWVPGCASGEECYTLAIILAEHFGSRLDEFRIEIQGSDLNPEALAIAESGLYRQTAFKETAPILLTRYFEHKGQHYQVKPAIHALCHFCREDIIRATAPQQLDMISCRNLLIYMKSELQDALFQKFHQALLPRGLLFLGQSESLGLLGNTLFMPVDHFHRLYRRK